MGRFFLCEELLTRPPAGAAPGDRIRGDGVAAVCPFVLRFHAFHRFPVAGRLP